MVALLRSCRRPFASVLVVVAGVFAVLIGGEVLATVLLDGPPEEPSPGSPAPAYRPETAQVADR